MPLDSSLDTATEPTRPPRESTSSGVIPLLVVGGLFAALFAAALLTLTAGPLDPNLVNAYGPIVVRVAGEIGCVLTVGSLLFAGFLVPPQRSGVLSAAGYAALRMASWSAALWFGAALLSVPFAVATAVGKPVSVVLDGRTLIDLVSVLPEAKAWLVTAAVAALIAVAARLVLSWGWTAALFPLAILGIVPVAVTGHSSSRQHDLASNSLLLHLVAVSLWVGGLVALLVHARRDREHLGLAASRFSKVALVCWVVMAFSGTINALIRVPLPDLFTTNYGVLVLAKTGALILLGCIGYVQRERGVREAMTGGTGAPLFRLAGMEVLIMFATLGLASALARTPPPPVLAEPDPVALRIGYALDGPPTLARLLLDWRPDLIFGLGAGVLLALYLAGVRRLRARGDAWPVGRTLAWLGGCAVVVIATSSGFGRYAPAMFSVHMQTHMMLSMLAPVLLVLGGPVTLALRALPAAGKDAPPGPREWLLAAVHSPVARVLTHPVVALVLFVGSFYVLYLSGLFDAALELHWAHLAMSLHFLVVGYLFYWPVIGIDPAPRRLPYLARLGMVFASLPFHAFFGVILMSTQTVIGERFYQGLALPWAADLLADQRLGGGIAWAMGELPLLIVLIALLVQWARADDREAKRSDRRADADGDADRAAYNAMLRKLAEGEGR
ncbi:cytochrome c oxidase assembly protein [Actinophytocola sp.]|uniref:cytochrome c oxidase assembly protein n=1 Tax=Actinophytocola sp. TaxID=1872138 RepID=UPI0039C8991D